jgi:excisionase family DNA binding protein
MSDQTLAERIAAMIEADKPAPGADDPELRPLSYTFKGAAKATGLSVNTLRREVRAERLKSTKVRGRVLITDDELRRFLKVQASTR